MIDAIRESSSTMVESINKMIEGIRQLIDALKDAKEAYADLGNGGYEYDKKMPVLTDEQKISGRNLRVTNPVKHKGGLVESHHEGNFAGNLRSNEVFAKLLKGEYVATEGQMKNFLNNILPKLSSLQAGAILTKNMQEDSGNGITMGDININVAGNLDKQIIPDIKEAVFEALNRAAMAKGKKTNAFTYSV